MKNTLYHKQVDLLLRALGLISKEKDFALKGGTAINLFVRDMPRLSIDIDLTYLPNDSRETSLIKISDTLKRVSNEFKKKYPGAKTLMNFADDSKQIRKIVIRSQDAQIKIEPNQVLRGSVFPTERHDLSKKAEELFGLFISVQTLSLSDLYGGKICAALDRQHPRDMFDIKILFENEGITESIRKAFVIYLASHGRAMSDLLDPSWKDMRKVYEKELVGMMMNPATYEELEKTRETLLSEIKKSLSTEERQFLVSIKKGEPDWRLIGIDGIENLPGLQWKLLNIQRMDKTKREKALENLKRKLDL